jgi:hypothetical protein
MIAIPAAAVFFGTGGITDVAGGGTFNIGMVSMPEVLRNFQGVEVFGTLWFLLLFFAAFTSSVAVAQPVVAFFQDELKLKKEASVAVVGLIWFLGTIPVIWFLKYGVLDDLDLWAGQTGLVACAIVEVILFAWIFGMKRGWSEMHRGADLQVPRFFGFIMKYVTPIALIVIFFGWTYLDAIKGGGLVPQPGISWGVINRGQYEGSFEKWCKTDTLDVNEAKDALKKAAKEAIDKTDTEEKRKAAKEAADKIDKMDVKEARGALKMAATDAAGEIEKGVKSAVQEAHRDLSAWADVEIDAQGNIKVTSFHADPALSKNLDGPKFERWLSLQEWHFKAGKLTEAKMAPAKVSIEFVGLNKAPFIWLARVMMVLIVLAFVVLIRIAWRDRPAPEGGVV